MGFGVTDKTTKPVGPDGRAPDRTRGARHLHEHPRPCPPAPPHRVRHHPGQPHRREPLRPARPVPPAASSRGPRRTGFATRTPPGSWPASQPPVGRCPTTTLTTWPAPGTAVTRKPSTTRAASWSLRGPARTRRAIGPDRAPPRPGGEAPSRARPSSSPLRPPAAAAPARRAASRRAGFRHCIRWAYTRINLAATFLTDLREQSLALAVASLTGVRR